MDISIPYYDDKTRISNSNIGWFLNKGPTYLHKMLTENVPEEKSQVLERGSMIHEYILQPEEFQKHYVVWNKEKPISAQQEKFCKELANTLEIEPNRAILSAYKEAYSTRGKSDDLMLSEGLKIASTLKDYINFLKLNDGRKMIGPWDVKMLEKIKQNIRNHKKALHTIWPVKYASDTFKWYHEFHINWDYYTEMSAYVKCKSLLDGLTLDFKHKTAIIYDLKTTQKLWHFEDSMMQYDYLRQIAFYKQAVLWYLEYECKENPKDWVFEYYIVGIDTTGSYDIRVFKIEERQVESRNNIIHDALRDIRWHQETGKWDHSRTYYEGNGSEHLDV